MVKCTHKWKFNDSIVRGLHRACWVCKRVEHKVEGTLGRWTVCKDLSYEDVA